MAKTKKKSPRVRCEKCTGLCCRYFALPLDTPEEWGDFDDIRWYLCHGDVTVFVEKGDWYLNVNNTCSHLSPTAYRCLIYDKRPRICRTYKTDDCDRTSDEYDYELHFTSAEQMEEYMKIKFGDKVFDKLEAAKKRKKKSKKLNK
ncbi:MAG: YkgJ family cysteine cluster protein [Phycisphaerae bacterium]|nr:YkgJ family cysteine cluster protein [Phycisphaerae bacterium]